MQQITSISKKRIELDNHAQNVLDQILNKHAIPKNFLYQMHTDKNKLQVVNSKKTKAMTLLNAITTFQCMQCCFQMKGQKKEKKKWKEIKNKSKEELFSYND